MSGKQRKQRKRMRRLEERVAELEAALAYRQWDMPPQIYVDMDPRPGLAEQLGTEPPILHPSTDPEGWGGYL